MAANLDQLSDKEKEVLRLMTRGHDAKSCAKRLGLSVHTINDRLRMVRRKLGVTSSREAARMLFEIEGALAPPLGANQGYKKLTPNPLGDASIGSSTDPVISAAKPRRAAFWIGGIALMSILTLALAITAYVEAPSLDADQSPSSKGSLTAQLVSRDAVLENVARDWLTLVDRGEWRASYQAAGAAFRKPNTLATWKAASHKARVPLGKALEREAVETLVVNAPPNDYTIFRFLTKFENGTSGVEEVTLEKEKGGWKVVAYVIN